MRLTVLFMFVGAMGFAPRRLMSRGGLAGSAVVRDRWYGGSKKRPGVGSTLLTGQTSLGSSSFDFEGKNTFDVLSLSSYRQRTLLQYNSTNQSEPLRIYLYLTLAVCLVGFPTLASSLDLEVSSVTSTVAQFLGVGAGGLFVRESGFRKRQLFRIELEARARELKLGQRNVGGTKVTTIGALDGQRRVLVFRGSRSFLSSNSLSAKIYRNRLISSNTIVVFVGESLETLVISKGAQWAAEPVDPQEWNDFFSALIKNGGGKDVDPNEDAWFGLNFRGRSFGSGVGSPAWDELLGRSLRPLEVFGKEDFEVDCDEMGPSITAFYDALKNGDEATMQSLFDSTDSTTVSDILLQGGRIDTWKTCLSEGARPDAIVPCLCDSIVDGDVAWTTNVELLDQGRGQSLLATQAWRKDATSGDWKLISHSTIPWTIESEAGGALRCDRRGCAAIVRK